MKFRTWIIFIISINVIGFPTFYLARYVGQYNAKRLFNDIKNNEKVFVYETYSGSLSPVFYVDDLKDTLELINYYKKVAKNDTTAYINFELKFMPLTLYKPIYVLRKFGKSSQIIELADFNNECWGVHERVCIYSNNS